MITHALCILLRTYILNCHLIFFCFIWSNIKNKQKRVQRKKKYVKKQIFLTWIQIAKALLTIALKIDSWKSTLTYIYIDNLKGRISLLPLFPTSGVSRWFILIVPGLTTSTVSILYTYLPHPPPFFPNFLRQPTYRVACSTLLAQGILCLSALYKTKKHPHRFGPFSVGYAFPPNFCSFSLCFCYHKNLIVSNCWGHPIQYKFERY